MFLSASSPEARRLLEAADMHEIGLELLRQRLRREHPEVGSGDIEEMVRAWVADRPYDSPGDPVDLIDRSVK
jgi:hypothetical protein